MEHEYESAVGTSTNDSAKLSLWTRVWARIKEFGIEITPILIIFGWIGVQVGVYAIVRFCGNEAVQIMALWFGLMVYLPGALLLAAGIEGGGIISSVLSVAVVITAGGFLLASAMTFKGLI